MDIVLFGCLFCDRFARFASCIPSLNAGTSRRQACAGDILTRLCSRSAIDPALQPATYSEFHYKLFDAPDPSCGTFAYLNSRLPPGIPPGAAVHTVAYTARRYLRYWFGRQAKIDIFRCHYDILRERFSSPLLNGMQAVSGMLLGELIGKSGRRYTVNLHYAMTNEGEIEIRFNDVDLRATLATIRGTFDRQADDRLVFWVGAIQGARPPWDVKKFPTPPATSTSCGRSRSYCMQLVRCARRLALKPSFFRQTETTSPAVGGAVGF